MSTFVLSEKQFFGASCDAEQASIQKTTEVPKHNQISFSGLQLELRWTPLLRFFMTQHH